VTFYLLLLCVVNIALGYGLAVYLDKSLGWHSRQPMKRAAALPISEISEEESLVADAPAVAPVAELPAEAPVAVTAVADPAPADDSLSPAAPEAEPDETLEDVESMDTELNDVNDVIANAKSSQLPPSQVEEAIADADELEAISRQMLAAAEQRGMVASEN
jgi:hypothetical protein